MGEGSTGAIKRLDSLRADLLQSLGLGDDGLEGPDAVARLAKIDEDAASGAIAALESLKQCKVTTDLLLQTQLGRVVKKLSKVCGDPGVKRTALDVLEAWKAVVAKEASSSASSPASMAAAPLPKSHSQKSASASNSIRGMPPVRSSSSGSVASPSAANKSGVTQASVGSNQAKKRSTPDGPTNGSEAGWPDRTDSKRPSPSPGPGEHARAGGVESRKEGLGGKLPGEKSTPEGSAEPKPPRKVVKFKVRALPPSGDAMRDKLRQVLVQSLCMVAEEAEGDELERARAVDVTDVAVAVEKGLWSVHGDTKDLKEYKDKWRSISFNLKDRENPDLRRRVLLGEVQPMELAVMSSEEMASDRKKDEVAKVKEKLMKETVRENNTMASTDQFKCGKCGQRKTTYFQMQTRSADEPMTTFVTCLNCNNRWKFC